MEIKITPSKKRLIFYLATLSVLVVIYAKFSEFVLIKELFLKSNLFWLSGIILTQIFHYYLVTLNYRDVLRIKDLDLPLGELFPATFVIQFLNQALPAAGLSGQAFFIQYLKKFGLSVAEGIGRAILELATVYVSFSLFFIISAFLIFQNGTVKANPNFLFFIYGFVFFLLFFGSLFLAFQKKERGRIAKWVIKKFYNYFEKNRADGEVNKAHQLAMIFDEIRATLNLKSLKARAYFFWLAVFWQILILFLDVLALYLISFAIGYPISFAIAFITFTLTKFISLVSFIPGALIIFETSMTLILISFGLPAKIALAVTILLRAFTFWLPMPIGWLLLRRYSRYEKAELRTTESVTNV